MPETGLTAQQRKEFVQRQAQLIRKQLEGAGKGKDWSHVKAHIVKKLGENKTQEKLHTVCDKLNMPESGISNNCLDRDTIGRLCTVQVEDTSKDYATEIRHHVFKEYLEPITSKHDFKTKVTYDKMYHTLMDVRDTHGNIKPPLKEVKLSPKT